MPLLKKILLRFVLPCAILLTGCFLLLLLPLQHSSGGYIQIKRGATLQATITRVDSAYNIPTPWFVEFSVKTILKFRKRTLQHGWFELPKSANQLTLIEILSGMRPRKTIRLTIPEGSTLREIAHLIQKNVGTDSALFMQWAQAQETLNQFAPNAPSMEGFVFPDTYNVYWKDDAETIGIRLAKAMQGASAGVDYDTRVLASIVQAEAASLEEMPRIAGVYANRLRIGMKLEADPTVQYGLGEKRRVLYSHLTSQNAYNTYVHKGLPPGPINNPGKAAMLAAQNPEQHNYLFFVARGDGSGKHYFAENGKQHAQNVQLYRRRRE